MPDRASMVRRLACAPVIGRVIHWIGSRYREGSVTTIRYGHAAGLRWRRHHRYVSGYRLGIYELEVQDALVQLIRPGMRVFDIGANTGFFTLLLAKLVGPDGEVIAVDPDPANIASLREQAELNPELRVLPVHAAVGASAGRATLRAAQPGSPLAQVLPDASGEGALHVVTIDDLVRAHGAADFIKMDIEGAELDALAGADGALTRPGCAWLIETHGLDIGHQVWTCLERNGYQPRRLHAEDRDPSSLQAQDHLMAAAVQGPALGSG